MPDRRGAAFRRSWRLVRPAVLARDGWRCKIVLPGCEGRADQVDHVVAIADGGAFFEMDNLQAACRHCNVTKENLQREGGSVRGSVRAW